MTRVLLVEDEPLVRIMAEEDLAELGCAVTAADSGDAAIDVLAGGAEFDVLVTDIRMPGSLDGWALAREVRRRFPGIGIVYVSGYAGETHDPLPGSHFVKKPYRLEQLHQAVRDSAA
jgi:CheY-like chemotaxis protein